MAVQLSHGRTRIEYILDMESLRFLIIEEYNPVLGTTNVVKIARMLHRDIHETIAPHQPDYQGIMVNFHRHKADLIERAKKAKEATKPKPKPKTKPKPVATPEPTPKPAPPQRKKATPKKARQLTAVA